MTASSNTSRAPRRRWVAAIITLVVVGLLGGLSWLGWGLRDRHPHFVLDVRLSPALTSALRVGFGRQRITPDLSRTARPVYLAGFSHNRRATEVHDDLWAIAAVFDDGTHRVGLVALDAIGLFHDDVVSLRSLAEAPNELDYVAVASTHNHSAPDLMGLWGPSPTRTGVDPAYREQVIRSAAQALHDAATAMAPARSRCRLKDSSLTRGHRRSSIQQSASCSSRTRTPAPRSGRS
jgi:hypothetical protein